MGLSEAAHNLQALWLGAIVLCKVSVNAQKTPSVIFLVASTLVNISFECGDGLKELVHIQPFIMSSYLQILLNMF